MSFDLETMDKPVDLAGGEWVGNLPGFPGARLKVRSKNYKPFETALNRLMRSYGRRAASASETPEFQAQLGELMAEHILLDWDRAVKRGGENVPFDEETAEKLLASNDERGVGQKFRDVVAWASGWVADLHLGIVDDLAGN